MSKTKTYALHIELTGGAEPIRGEVADGDHIHSFEGWLELNWAIQRALASDVALTDDTTQSVQPNQEV